jgi:SAM-dependent methyltransferase
MEYVGGAAADRWRGMVEARQRQMDAAYTAIGRTSADFWARRLGTRPSMLSRVAGDDDPTIAALLPFLSSDTTVLDVGAGAGRYALGIAPHVRSVTAVEPDGAMLPRLESAIQESGISNVAVVRSTWQEERVAPSDIVLCAHMLYPIADAEDFIRKLDEAALQACFVVLRDVVPEPEPLGRLWTRFHGEPRRLQPGYAEAFNLLYELGIHANLRVSTTSGPSWHFEDDESAIDGVREHLILPNTPEVNAELREQLSSTLDRGGGMLGLPSPDTYLGVLWWEK